MASESGSVPRRRKRLVRAWRVFNPIARPFAGVAPWWVLVETTGRKTGEIRRTPIARGFNEGEGMWLIAAHGRHAAWVRNIEASPNVRLKSGGSWRGGRASIHPYDADRARRFNVYARAGAGRVAIDPLMVRVDFKDR